MIIVKLTGGLGNQLFQYALGRHLAIKNKCQFKLDITGFETYKLHNYTLPYFNITEMVASPLEILWLKNPARRVLERFLPFSMRSYAEERGFTFDPNIFNVGSNIYIDGYWQSEKYFKEIEDIIRKDFTLKEPISEEAKRISEQIMKSESVSLHIRRGDYAKNERTKKVHGLCSPEYYSQALAFILRKTANPKLFIFSDDITWAKTNLDLHDIPAVFVSDGNDKVKNFEELYLMNLCKHNIIANSTFSWWGAWLNSNVGKIVIAPKRWFVDETKNTNDLIPETWIRI